MVAGSWLILFLPPWLPHNPGLPVVHAEPHHGGQVEAEVEEDKERDGNVEIDHLFGFFVLHWTLRHQSTTTYNTPPLWNK